jgi:4-hydroxy-tetrahydrodipicolinate reductase
MIRLAVSGATGRMGTRVVELAQHDARFTVVERISRADHERIAALHDGAQHVACDAIIDFSVDDGSALAMEMAERSGAALLVGTTALSAQSVEKMGLCARSVPVMHAPNTSRGVAVVNHLIATAARLLGCAYDIDIIDTHHRAKRDAPSGTALRLVQSLRDQAGVTLDSQRVHSLRTGDVVGDHEVIFAGSGEQIKISHSAISRDVFALGALEATAWLHEQPAGMYRIEQSLGLDIGPNQPPITDR